MLFRSTAPDSETAEADTDTGPIDTGPVSIADLPGVGWVAAGDVNGEGYVAGQVDRRARRLAAGRLHIPHPEEQVVGAVPVEVARGDVEHELGPLRLPFPRSVDRPTGELPDPRLFSRGVRPGCARSVGAPASVPSLGVAVQVTDSPVVNSPANVEVVVEESAPSTYQA